jgi:hypothetical protein
LFPFTTAQADLLKLGIFAKVYGIQVTLLGVNLMHWISAVAHLSMILCCAGCKPGLSSGMARETRYTVGPGEPITHIRELVGRWTGRSSCEQRLLDITLDIVLSNSDQIEGTLKYSSVFKNVGFPMGIYRLHGVFNNGNLNMIGDNARDWISKPDEVQTLKNLSGRINSTTYRGQLVECQQTFTLTRRPATMAIMPPKDSSIWHSRFR